MKMKKVEEGEDTGDLKEAQKDKKEPGMSNDAERME